MTPFNYEDGISHRNVLDDVLQKIHVRREEGWWVILGPTEAFDSVFDWIVYMIGRGKCEYSRSEEPHSISILSVDFDKNEGDMTEIWSRLSAYVNTNSRVIALKGTPQECLDFFKTAPLTESN